MVDLKGVGVLFLVCAVLLVVVGVVVGAGVAIWQIGYLSGL